MANEEQVEQLAGKYLEIVKRRLKMEAEDFLDSNQEAKDLVERCLKSLAELNLDYMKADDAERVKIQAKMERLEAAIETELLAVANNVSAQAQNTLKTILRTFLAFAKEAFPIIIAAL